MNRYEEKKIIGRGNYGTAVLAKDLVTGTKVVIKKIPLLSLSEKERRDAASECKLLSQLHHPNIVEYVDSFLEEGTLHLVTQFCELGDLSQVIKNNKKRGEYFQEKQIIDWFIQIVMAVDHIHSKNVMHRDLKTGNVFLTKTNVVKLGDFGIAKVLDSTLEQAQTVVGTPYFMSPEVCENKQYDHKSDMWAMGCILYELCTLNHAFDASNLLGLVFKIVQENYTPIPDHYSNDLRDLIHALLSKDPAERPSCRKIFRLPFIRKRLQELAQASSLCDESKSAETSSIPQAPLSPPPPPPPPIQNEDQPNSRDLRRSAQNKSSNNAMNTSSNTENSTNISTTKKEENKLKEENRGGSSSTVNLLASPPNISAIGSVNFKSSIPLTPQDRCKERKDAANKKREEELREASLRSIQSRAEARRRSEQLFQVSAENHLKIDQTRNSSESTDDNNSKLHHRGSSLGESVETKSGESGSVYSKSTKERSSSGSSSLDEKSQYSQPQSVLQQYDQVSDRWENKNQKQPLNTDGQYEDQSNLSGLNPASTRVARSVSGTVFEESPKRNSSIGRPTSVSNFSSVSSSSTSIPDQIHHRRIHSEQITETSSRGNGRPTNRPRSSSTASNGQSHLRSGLRGVASAVSVSSATSNGSSSAFSNPRYRSVTADDLGSVSSFASDPFSSQFDERPIRSSGHYSIDDNMKDSFSQQSSPALRTSGLDKHQNSAAPNSNRRSLSGEFDSDPSDEDQLKDNDSKDAEMVLAECKRRALTNEGYSSSQNVRRQSLNHEVRTNPASNGVGNLNQGPNWKQISEKQKRRLRNALGEETFDKVYAYLKHARSIGENNSKESQRGLRQFVSKDKLDLAFEVDQLLFIEDVHCSSH